MEAASSYSFTSAASIVFLLLLHTDSKEQQQFSDSSGRKENREVLCPFKGIMKGGGGHSFILTELRNSRLTQAHGNTVPTHLVELSSESDCSDCSRPWEASEGAGCGSGFRIRNKRKQPTRLITVREMNTVRRSLSETRATVSKLDLLF